MSRARVRERERTSGYRTADLLAKEKDFLLKAASGEKYNMSDLVRKQSIQDSVNRMILLETQGSRTREAVVWRIESCAPVMTAHPDTSLEFVTEVREMRR